MKDAIKKFFTVKTVITLVALGLWIYTTVTNKVDGEFFKTIFTMVISFYFGTQHEKRAIEDGKENSET